MSPEAEEYMRLLMEHYDAMRSFNAPAEVAERMARLTATLTEADCDAINVCRRASQIAAIRVKRGLID